MQMICNLHTHTFRCNHASGTEKEYIEHALRHGLKIYGFADHSPYYFPGEHYSGFRMRPELQEDYVNTLLALREEYKGVIDIKIGYEVEYYPAFFSETLKMLTRYPVDYLILGQHYIDNEVTGKYSGSPTEDESYLAQYVDEVSEAMATGLYTYVAHPDLFNYVGPRSIYEKQYARLILNAKDLGMPLEVNLLGVNETRHYPRDIFWELCGQIGAEVCIGCDAHRVSHAFNPEDYAKALKIVEKYGLKLNMQPTLRPVHLI